VRRAVVLVVAAAVATVAVVVGGVLTLGGSEDDPADPTEAPFTTTPLADYDTSTAVVARGPFCEALDDRQVEAALDAAPASSTSWQNGDKVEVSPGVRDVTHEFGCQYAAADGTVAHAWVFAPPVEATQAQRLVTSAGKGPGCVAADGPPFGSPALALTCTTEDGVQRASYRGLFGDSWLVCEVVRPAGATWDPVDRAGRWCVGVLQAAS
jgi:pyruvate/2-oxoglutarate dehydrogenase complex dihydrolipoamide acyltransferase (E2) component